jgi:hypothetical protein
MNTSIFICQLSQQKQDLIQKKVKRHLTLEGHTKDYIQEVIGNVMADRLVNLQEIINVNQFL